MITLPDGSLHIDPNGAGAQVDVDRLAVIDEPKFPKAGPTYPAVQSFSVAWKATGNGQTLTDPAKYFQITGRPATIEARFAVSEPARGFSFRGEATATHYAFVGEEANGYYFDKAI